MSAIKAGDLVMVAYPPRCHLADDFIGHTFIAGEVFTKSLWHCATCHARHATPTTFVTGPCGNCFASYRLKKLNPPPERITRDEEAHA